MKLNGVIGVRNGLHFGPGEVTLFAGSLEINYEEMVTMLNPGDDAPEFNLPGDRDETLSLADFKGKRLVIFFYPRDNTSGCTAEANEFQELLPEFEKLNAAVVGVSKDSVKSHEKFRAKHGFTYPLLSDTELQMLQAYGAWGEKKLYGKVSMGTIRTTVVVDAGGNVELFYAKVKAKGHAAKVLADMRGS